jgi:type IV pilus assembly protein PilM
MARSVVGVDIGSEGLRAVEVKDPAAARPTVLRYHSLSLPAGAVARGEVIEPNTVATVLKELWAQGGFKSKDVVLGMGNQRVLSRDLTVAKMSLKRIRESLPFIVQDLLPIPVADALLDFYPVSEADGENGPQVNGLLIAAVKEAVQGNVQAVELAGLTPVEVDLIPFALSRVVLRGSVSEAALVQVDVGAGTTTVVITLAGVPQFMRLIPTGGADLTQALVTRLGIDADQAEELKLTVGLTTPSNPEYAGAVGVIREVTTELLTSLRNTINYFSNTRHDVVVNRIVLTGGGAQLRGFPEALSELTRVAVSPAMPSDAVQFGRDVDAENFKATQGAFLVALGLAMGSAA